MRRGVDEFLPLKWDPTRRDDATEGDRERARRARAGRMAWNTCSKRIVHANLLKSMGVNASRWRRRERLRAEWKIEASRRLGRNRPGRCDR